ncbi:MAG: PEP-CTERM sorting domain-containing protein [Candidatus Hodarchaeota archaeon]
MNRIKRFLSILIFLSFTLISVNGEAVLTRWENLAGETVVYDDNTGFTWLNAMGDFSGKNYSDQMITLGDINADDGYYGATNWRFGTLDEVNYLLDNNLTGNIFDEFDWECNPPLHPDSNPAIFGRSSTEGVGDTHIYVGIWSDGTKHIAGFDDSLAEDYHSAWIITESQLNPPPSVPEPSLSLLFLFSIVLFIGFKKRYKV